MAVGFSCKCPERKKPVKQRNWVVTQYKWNSGDFVVDGGEYSDYSEVRCLSCCSRGRTKAQYVESLKLMSETEAYDISIERAKTFSNQFDKA